MDRYIGEHLDRQYQDLKSKKESMKGKAVIDLVLQSYLQDGTKISPDSLDPEFRAFAISQIRLFLFVGHDSTSSTICYLVHLLATNPDALARLRAEHDTVFGADIATVCSTLGQHPHLLNNLPYTSAVIKETLRLFPPASCSRQGKPNVDVVDDQGNHCPTDHAMVWILHVETHRSPQYWSRPEEFLPERWLVEADDDLYPMKGAWRAFEHGPRNCMAQGLVMMELRVVLVLIAREFEFQPSYAEWDRLHPRKGLKTWRGERVYQIEEAAAHPVEQYPCRVALRKL